MRHQVWTAFETVADMPEWEAPVSWLTPFENGVFGRLSVPKRREEWLLGRYAAKRLVQRVAWDVLGRAMALDAFEVATHDSGAPFARTASGEKLPLSISISHSHGAAFCAVLPLPPPGETIGADLELLEPRSEPFVRDFFTSAEAASWEKASPMDRPLLANAIWSAKESVLKALGLGLTADTRSVDITLFDEPPKGPVRPRDGVWSRFDAALGSAFADEGVPLAGFWRCEGPFVATLASRTASKGRNTHASH